MVGLDHTNACHHNGKGITYHS